MTSYWQLVQSTLIVVSDFISADLFACVKINRCPSYAVRDNHDLTSSDRDIESIILELNV